MRPMFKTVRRFWLRRSAVHSLEKKVKVKEKGGWGKRGGGRHVCKRSGGCKAALHSSSSRQ